MLLNNRLAAFLILSLLGNVLFLFLELRFNKISQILSC